MSPSWPLRPPVRPPAPELHEESSMAKTYSDLIAEAKESVKIVPLDELKRRLEQKEPMVARRRAREGRVSGRATSPAPSRLPRGYLEQQFEQKLPDKNAPIVVYCAGGHAIAPSPPRRCRSSATRGVESANPGFVRWKDLRFPVETPPSLTDAQRDRYSRHILLPEVGEAGQAKLLGVEGAAARRGRAREPCRALPRGRGRRHARPRRRRHGRCVEPAAADPPRHEPRRHAQGRERRQGDSRSRTPT